jgi:hypothetical protein
MDIDKLKLLIRNIIKKSLELKNRHTTPNNAPVNYVCIFAHSQEEYESLLSTADQLGKIARDTLTGPIFQIDPLETDGGKLRVLKVRKPDQTRLEVGDADFTIIDYEAFKKTYLQTPGFKLIQRPEMEMVELVEPNCEVRVYFSNPPMDRQLGLV